MTSPLVSSVCIVEQRAAGLRNNPLFMIFPMIAWSHGVSQLTSTQVKTASGGSVTLRSWYMGVLRQWKWAPLGWEQAQSGQNQHGHQKKHVMAKKQKRKTDIYVWMKRISLLLCSELFSITSLLHINILPAQKYLLLSFLLVISLINWWTRDKNFLNRRSGQFMSGLTLFNKCIHQLCSNEAIFCLCCQILALILPLGARCVWSTSLTESRTSLQGPQVL